jgi:tetratricopeptide (TPR) repeat protein
MVEEQVRGAFFTGNFFKAVEACKGQVSSSALLLSLRAVLELRGQSLPDVSKLPVPAANLALLRDYLNGARQPDSVLENLTEDNQQFNEIVRAIILLNTGESEQVIDSIKAVSGEGLGLAVLAMLQIHRVDIAENLTKRGLEANDEDTALQVVSCVVSIFKGEYDEAYATLNELLQKYGDSPLLLNNYAICAMQDGNLEEADQALNRALELSQSLSRPDFTAVSLVNLISLKRQQGSSVSDLEM